MRCQLALVALFAAGPISAQSQTCEVLAENSCDLGLFHVDLFTDSYSPLLNGSHGFFMALVDGRFDIGWNLQGHSQTLPTSYDTGPSWNFEDRVFFTIYPTSPAVSFYRSSVTASGGATFSLPNSNAWATLTTSFRVSNENLGLYVATNCYLTGSAGAHGCQLASSSTALPFASLPYGYITGHLSINSFYNEAGGAEITANYQDMSVVGSIYFQNLTPVPEPATVGLLAIGLVGVGLAAWRRRLRDGSRRHG